MSTEGAKHSRRNRRRAGLIAVVVILVIGVLVAAMDAEEAMHILRHPEFLLIVLDWAMSVLALGACFLALRTPVHPGVLLTGFAIGVSVGFASMLPGGLGAQEGSMAGIYVLLGVGYERALLAAMLFRLIYYVVPFAASLALYAHLLRSTPAEEPAPG